MTRIRGTLYSVELVTSRYTTMDLLGIFQDVHLDFYTDIFVE